MTDKPDRNDLITRREAILRVSALFGGVALVGQAAMLAGCEDDTAADATARRPGALFTANEIELLDEIAETILPETDTPGAKAAGVGAFIAMMVADTYFDADQAVFRAGLDTVQARSEEMHGTGFLDATPVQRNALLVVLDAEQHEHMQARADGAAAHYFRMLKELTLLGYFTSEIGYTQAMRYVESPGRFDPCVTMAPGEKSWADHA